MLQRLEQLCEDTGFCDGASDAHCDLATGVCSTRAHIRQEGQQRARLYQLVGRWAARYAACYFWGYCHVKEQANARGRTE